MQILLCSSPLWHTHSVNPSMLKTLCSKGGLPLATPTAYIYKDNILNMITVNHTKLLDLTLTMMEEILAFGDLRVGKVQLSFFNSFWVFTE